MENKEDCSNCQSMREQVEELKRKHLLDFRTIKQKIISTDELIKLYQKKCQEFDKQTKCLSELTTKLEASQRNMDVVHLQLQKSLELNEPLKKARNELEKEKDVRKIEMQKLQDKLRGSENLVSQLKNVVKEKERSEGSFKLDALIQGQEIEEKKRSLKKSEAMVTKLKEQIVAEKSGKKETNKQLTSSQNQLKKKEKQVGDFQQTIENLKDKLNEAKKEITELKKRSKENIYSPSPPKQGRITRRTFTRKQQEATAEKSSEILSDEIMDRILDFSSCFSLSPLPPSPCSAEKTDDDDDDEFGNADPDYIDDNDDNDDNDDGGDGGDDDHLCDDGSTQSVDNVDKQKNDVSESTASESVCSEPPCTTSEGDSNITNSARRTDRECSPECNSGTLDKDNDVATQRSTPLSTTLISKRKRNREIFTQGSQLSAEDEILKTKTLSENTNAKKPRETPQETKTTKTESENHLTNSETNNSETNSLNPSGSLGENTILMTSTSLPDSRSKARTEEVVEQEVATCLRSIIEAVDLQESSSANLRTSQLDSPFVIETNFEAGLVDNSCEIIPIVDEDVLGCLKSVMESVSNTVKHPSVSLTTDILAANVQGLARNEQPTVSESGVEVVDAEIVVIDEKKTDVVSSLTCNQWHENVDDYYTYSEGSSVSSDQVRGPISFFDVRNGLEKTDGKRSPSGCIFGNAANKADLKRYAEDGSNGVPSNGEKARDSELDSRFDCEGEIDKELAGIGGVVVGCSNKSESDLQDDAENINMSGVTTNEEIPRNSESDSRFDCAGEIDKELAGIGGRVVVGCSNKSESDLQEDVENINMSGVTTTEEKPRDSESDSRFNTEGKIDEELAGIGGLVVVHGCSNKPGGDSKNVAENISGVLTNEEKPKDSQSGSRCNTDVEIKKDLAGVGGLVVKASNKAQVIPIKPKNISGVPTNEEKPKDSQSGSRCNTDVEIKKELAGVGGLVVKASNKAQVIPIKPKNISGVPTNEEKPKDSQSGSRCNTDVEIKKELAGVGGLVVKASNKVQVDVKEHTVNVGRNTKTSEADSCFNPWENVEKVEILKEGSPECHLNSSLTFSPDLPAPLSPIPDSPERPTRHTEIPSFEVLDNLPPLSPIPPSPKGLSSTVDPQNEAEDSETKPHEQLEIKKLAELPPTSTVSKLSEHASPSRVPIPAKQFSADDCTNVAEKIAAPARRNKTPVKKAPVIRDALDRSPKAKEHGYVSRLLVKVKKGEITTEVATKRFSIITNLRASSPFVSALLQILKSTSDAAEDELSKKYTEQCVGDETACENVWQPVISEFEMRVVVVVRELSKLKQFYGLICCLLSLLGKTMFGLFRSGDGSSAVLAICRVYTTVCRLAGDGGRVRVLCFDIMKENQRHLLTNKIIMSVGLVWPDVLRKNKRVPSLLAGKSIIHGPFVSTLQVITMSRETSSEFEQSILVLQRLCGWSKMPCGKEALELLAFQLVRLLRESSELAAQHTTLDFGPSMGSEAFEAVKSLELLVVVLGWQWTNDVLVRDHLWPVLEEWKRRELCRGGAVEGANGNLGAAGLAREITIEKNETVVGDPQMEITMEVEHGSQGSVVVCDDSERSGLKEVEMDAKTTDYDNYCRKDVEEISDGRNEHNSNAVNSSNGFHSEAKLKTSSKDIMPGMNEAVDCCPKTEEIIGFQTTDGDSVTTRDVLMDTTIAPLKRSDNLGDQDEREPSIEKHSMEATVVSVLRLLGLLGLVGLQQEQVDLDAVVNLMCAVMACVDDFKGVTFPIQLAAAYAVLDMIKANPMKILNVLNEWTTRMEDERNGKKLPARFTEQLQYFRTYLSTTKPS